jgi:hypothetical protein
MMVLALALALALEKALQTAAFQRKSRSLTVPELGRERELETVLQTQSMTRMLLQRQVL